MDDDDVGYARPPKRTRFKPGTSGNPRGRPHRTASPLGEIVNDVFNTPVRYREKGRTRTATRRELALRMLVHRAISGDLVAADIVLRKRTDALRRARTGSNRLLIRDWLPDHPGQTAEQKNQNLEVTVERSMAESNDANPKHGRSPNAGGS